ncbi:MAG TPA: outer membrane protein assembly factor BamA [Gemmatimonadaceae bacterium]|nr:outer membrane protein assembly factor BamA [Gemmatimonadaceae bacterium]
MFRVASTSVALLLGATLLHAQESAVAGACARPDSVAFRGNARVSDPALRGDVGITPGSELNYRTLQRAIKNLYATTQFEDIRVHCDVAAGRAILAFELKERELLGDVDVRGAERVSGTTLRDQVDLLIGRPIDPSLVARSIARMDSIYAAKGFYLARVRAETTQVATGAKITFVVEEGQRMAVSGVRVDGNSKIGDREIVSAMATKPEGFWWWRKGEFDDNKYAADLTEHIPQTYGRHGFIDMTLTKDTLVVDRARGKALVDVGVNEGPQYVVGDFEVNGARRFSNEDLRKFYPFEDRTRSLREAVSDVAGVITRRSSAKDPPNVFDESKWEAATAQVQEAYSNEGYIYAQVRPVIERVRVGKDSVPTVNLRWDIDERTPAIVNRVEITGNDITTESCIRDQILMFPGDVFNRDRLLRSYQSISQMGFFETPVPQPDVRPANDQGDVDIVFHVKEKKTGNVSFGASVGQGTGVGGFIGFDQPNLFGMCKRGSLQWQFGKYINDFNLSYTDPRIRETRVSGTVTAYHTRSRFIVGSLGRTTRAGAQLRFGFPVPGSRWTRLFLDYGGESVAYGEDQGTLTSTINCGAGVSCFRSSVGLTLDRDTRLDMPFPSMGAHQALTAEFNGGPLGGTAAYQRYTGELRGYATLAQFGGGTTSSPLKIVTGLSTKVGALFGNPGPFFIYQQFSLGGVQYGEQLRGYEEFSITPNGYIGGTGTFQAQPASFGSAFLTTSAELGLRVSQQLYVSSFFDAGNIWARPRDFNPTRLFRGAGFGAALVTPLGPLGLDLGYGFDRVDAFGRRAPKWQVHFKFGQFF